MGVRACHVTHVRTHTHTYTHTHSSSPPHSETKLAPSFFDTGTNSPPPRTGHERRVPFGVDLDS